MKKLNIKRDNIYYRPGTGNIAIAQTPDATGIAIGDNILLNGYVVIVTGIERKIYATWPPKDGETIGLVFREKTPVEATPS